MEIAAGEKLLKDMEEAGKWEHDKTAPTLKDAFGHRQHLQLGIPIGDNGHRLLEVSPVLGQSMIRAHIAQKQKELVEANEMARVELDVPAAPPVTGPLAQATPRQQSAEEA
jgi:hypothetical protein